jgi:hypothetical protein
MLSELSDLSVTTPSKAVDRSPILKEGEKVSASWRENVRAERARSLHSHRNPVAVIRESVRCGLVRHREPRLGAMRPRPLDQCLTSMAAKRTRSAQTAAVASVREIMSKPPRWLGEVIKPAVSSPRAMFRLRSRGTPKSTARSPSREFRERSAPYRASALRRLEGRADRRAHRQGRMRDHFCPTPPAKVAIVPGSRPGRTGRERHCFGSRG